MSLKLLTRDEFRNNIFLRDSHKCVICGSSNKLDAHHIMERRLFPDGGYYLDNGATLCDDEEDGCHYKAETTEYSTEYVRERAGITTIVLPPHLYRDQKYDKWGNPYLNATQRLYGELYFDPSVSKLLNKYKSDFINRVKYPRTYHLPYSPSVSKDDRVRDLDFPNVECVVTVKMDGENFTGYNDYCHARSVNSGSHESRNMAKAIWGNIAHEIPNGWRICCENLYAKHSLHYQDLKGYLQLFSIWNDKNECLSWDDTEVWANLLNLPLVDILFKGIYDSKIVKTLAEDAVKNGHEGIVVRVADTFPYSKFKESVAKYVRPNHVTSENHWIHQQIVPNLLNGAK